MRTDGRTYASDFGRLWLGQTVSLAGTYVSLVALPLLAALRLHATPVEMGILGAAGPSAGLSTAIFSGVIVDRCRRRPLMIAADVGRALAMGSIPVAAAVHQLTFAHLVVAGLVVGVLGSLFDVAAFAYVPELVPTELLVFANGRLETARSVASVAGSSLGGALVQATSAVAAVAFDAFSFVVSAIGVAAIRHREHAPPRREPATRAAREIGDGFRLLFRNSLLRTLTLSQAAYTVSSTAILALMVLYWTRDLGFSPSIVGVCFAALGIGFAAGAFSVARIVARLGVGWTILFASLGVVAGLALLPAAGGHGRSAVALTVTAEFVIGWANQIVAITAVSLRQAATPRQLRGRAVAAHRVVAWAPGPFAAVGAGVLAEGIGLRGTLAAAAALGLASPCVLLGHRIWRVRTLEGPVQNVSGAPQSV